MNTSSLNSKDIDALKNSFLFKNVNPDVMLMLLKEESCTAASFENGETVFDKNNFKRCLCFVLNGRLSVVKPVDNREMPMKQIDKYGFFGAAALFNEGTAYVTKIIAQKKTTLIMLPQELISRYIILNSALALNYISFLTNRILYLNDKIDLLIASSSRNALVSYLCTVAEDGKDCITLDMPYQQLASQLNMSRASLYRALDSLEEQGIIKRDGRKITINNFNALIKS